jgi:hypothetical protein
MADDDPASFKLAIADHPNFAMALARIFELRGESGEHERGIFKVEASFL